MLWSSTFSLWLLAGGVQVEARPADTTCPTAPAVEAALAGEKVRGDPGPGWQLVYRVERSFPGDGHAVTATLRDGSGTRRLERKVTVPSGQCEAAASVLALVVQQFFDDIAWSSGGPLPTAAARPDTDVAARAEGPIPSRRAWGMLLGAGPAFLTTNPSTPRALVEARLTVAPLRLPRLRFGVGAWLPGRETSESLDAGGEARAVAWPVRLSASAVAGGDRFEIEGGPQATISYESAEP